MSEEEEEAAAGGSMEEGGEAPADPGDSAEPEASGDAGGVNDADEAAIENNTASMLAAFQEEPSQEAAGEDSAEAQIEQQTEEMLQASQEEEGEEAHGEDQEEDGAAEDEADQGGSQLAPVTYGSVAQPSKETTKDGKEGRLMKVKGMDKQQLCIDLLMVGCVQSFVDFFYITHRKLAPNDNNSSVETESKDLDLPEDTLIFLKETLESAESARRASQYQVCFEAYNNLAEYFEKVPDLKGAMYFYKRCADVATEVDARESMSKAFLNLGACEERSSNWQIAMEYHERALQIATSADSLPLQIKAASRLTQVYQVLAENCEKEGRDSEATALYERCKDCAQLSKDATLEGTACHKLGLSKYKTGHFEAAVELQKQYLDICRVQDDRIGESAARGALAQAYEAMGVAQEAIKQLENLLNVASEAGELKAQASACLNLGILYNGRGDHEKSVELLEQHFDLARQIGDRRLIDSARVVLGMVRGNGKLKSYIDLVNNDLDKLLKWKSKRATLDG